MKRTALFLSLSVLVCGAIAATGCNTQPATAGPIGAVERPKPGVLDVTGTATLQVTPDVLDVHMTLTVEHDQPKQAVAALRRQQAALLAKLSGADVAGDEITTGQLSLYPVYESRSPYRIRAYQASITVTICTGEFDRVGEIMETAAAAGVTQMSTNFRSTKLEELKKQVRDMALQAAKDKAAQMSGALDVRVSRVTAIREEQAGGGWYYGRLEVANAIDYAGAAGGAAVQPATQPLTLTVHISYELG